MDLTIVEQHLILVEMPRRMSFAEWGAVQIESAASQEEAIEKAISRTPALTEYVPPGIMRFMAVPVRRVPIKRAAVVGQELVTR